METEAYAELGDEACHTWNRPGARNFMANHSPGDAYVYLNYGVHWMFNFLVKGKKGGGFVLLRAVEPMDGMEAMRRRRPGVPDALLAAGPGRLTRAFGITGADHGVDFREHADWRVTRGRAGKVVAGERIGISRASEMPWRFGDPTSPSLSRKFGPC